MIYVHNPAETIDRAAVLASHMWSEEEGSPVEVHGHMWSVEEPVTEAGKRRWRRQGTKTEAAVLNPLNHSFFLSVQVS